MTTTNKIRAIAFYLPQFHPIPENNEWWEKGFTEWTNVTKAKPLFRGHHQPNLPGELGFYDLRLREVREQQATLAKEYGIEGFLYWHYWFNGRRILERPFNEVLADGKPDFPFCLGWANESWTGIWHGLKDKTLIKQTYPGEEDYISHFKIILPAFKDNRYITVDEKPIFLIYNPSDIPNCQSFIDLWQKLAKSNKLPGIYFVALSRNPDEETEQFINMGFDGIHSQRIGSAVQKLKEKPLLKIQESLLKLINNRKNTSFGIFQYKDIIKELINTNDRTKNIYPMIIPNWDNSPRSGDRSLIFENSTPELFRQHIKSVFSLIKDKPPQHRIVFIKSWNEWAEGNYLEPDRKYGRRYLEIFKEEQNNII